MEAKWKTTLLGEEDEWFHARGKAKITGGRLGKLKIDCRRIRLQLASWNKCGEV